MLLLKLPCTREAYEEVAHLHSTMLLLKWKCQGVWRCQGVIYIPLCYYLNELYEELRATIQQFTFHYATT